MGELWFRFMLAALATWRLAMLLAHDDGPWDATLRLRRALGDGQFGRMLDCFRCVSLWVSAPLAFAVGRSPLEWLLAWLALSGAACLLERLGGPPLSIEQWDNEGDANELLRTETGGLGEGGPGEAGAAAARSRAHHHTGAPGVVR